MTTLMGYAIVEKVINEVCAAYEITRAEMVSPCRTEVVAWPRMVAMALAYEESDLNAAEVGQLFRRCRTSVYHAVDRVYQRVRNNKKTHGAKVWELRAKIQHEKEHA